MTKDEKVKLEKVDKLISAIEEVYPSTKVLILKSFIRGIFIGLGTTIGVSIVLAALTFAISQLKVVPFVSDIISQYNLEQTLEEQQR